MVVGFVIGFGFVFAVGLLYAKVQRVRRFKLLDNASGNSVNLPLIGTLNNTVPAFGITPTTLTASAVGNISGGIYNNGATNVELMMHK